MKPRCNDKDMISRAGIQSVKQQRKRSKEARKSFRPYYDRRHKTWRVEFPDRDAEEGDLLYVASEFARTGLYFPHNDSTTKGKEYSGHSHEFEGVLAALLDDPAGFTIDGFEEYYSDQERKMLRVIQEKLKKIACTDANRI